MEKWLFILAMLLISMQNMAGQNFDTISIENVNVIPMTEEVVLDKQRVIIMDGKIVKVEPTSNPIQYQVSLTIDGTGKYLIPGLSEMHYHLRNNDPRNDFKLLIANGITTARNMAERDGQDHIAIRNKILVGDLLGPNYYTTGPYLQADDLQNLEQVMDVVKSHIDKGYDFLKIADNLPLEIYLELLEVGGKNGIPIIGHAQRNLPLEYSLRMKSIEHVEEFLYISTDDSGKKLYKEDLAELSRVALQLKQTDIYIGSTLVVFDFINQCLDDKKFAELQKHELVKYLPKQERANFLTEKNDYRKMRNSEFEGVKAETLFADYFLWIKAFTRILIDNGVHLLSGSDTYGMVIPGFSLHKEFKFLQEAGVAPYNILLASTVNPARYLNKYASEGTIAAGKNANLVLLAKNPLDNIENTQSIEGVMLKGHWFNRAQLDVMLKEVESAYK